MGSLIAGPAAGVGFWLFIYPADYAKTMLQTDSFTSPKYKGWIDCLKKEAPKGVRVIFTGYGIMVVRAMVCSAAGFLGFEVAKKVVY